MNIKKVKIYEILGLIVIFSFSFIVYEIKEFSTSLLLGIDGPYYYIQVSSILKHGYIKYSDPPLTFYILILFVIIFKDIMISIKIGSIFITLIAIFPIYYLIKNLSNKIRGLAASLFMHFPLFWLG